MIRGKLVPVREGLNSFLKAGDAVAPLQALGDIVEGLLSRRAQKLKDALLADGKGLVSEDAKSKYLSLEELSEKIKNTKDAAAKKKLEAALESAGKVGNGEKIEVEDLERKFDWNNIPDDVIEAVLSDHADTFREIEEKLTEMIESLRAQTEQGNTIYGALRTFGLDLPAGKSLAPDFFSSTTKYTTELEYVRDEMRKAILSAIKDFEEGEGKDRKVDGAEEDGDFLDLDDESDDVRAASAAESEPEAGSDEFESEIKELYDTPSPAFLSALRRWFKDGASKSSIEKYMPGGSDKQHEELFAAAERARSKALPSSEEKAPEELQLRQDGPRIGDKGKSAPAADFEREIEKLLGIVDDRFKKALSRWYEAGADEGNLEEYATVSDREEHEKILSAAKSAKAKSAKSEAPPSSEGSQELKTPTVRGEGKTSANAAKFVAMLKKQYPAMEPEEEKQWSNWYDLIANKEKWLQDEGYDPDQRDEILLKVSKASKSAAGKAGVYRFGYNDEGKLSWDSPPELRTKDLEELTRLARSTLLAKSDKMYSARVGSVDWKLGFSAKKQQAIVRQAKVEEAKGSDEPPPLPKSEPDPTKTGKKSQPEDLRGKTEEKEVEEMPEGRKPETREKAGKTEKDEPKDSSESKEPDEKADKTKDLPKGPRPVARIAAAAKELAEDDGFADTKDSQTRLAAIAAALAKMPEVPEEKMDEEADAKALLTGEQPKSNTAKLVGKLMDLMDKEGRRIDSLSPEELMKMMTESTVIKSWRFR